VQGGGQRDVLRDVAVEQNSRAAFDVGVDRTTGVLQVVDSAQRRQLTADDVVGQGFVAAEVRITWLRVEHRGRDIRLDVDGVVGFAGSEGRRGVQCQKGQWSSNCKLLEHDEFLF